METQILRTDRLTEDVRILKEWMSQEPHLPRVQDDELIKMCLHYNKYNFEKTKTKIDNYFSYRNKYPQVFKNRDPLASEIKESAIAHSVCMADRLTKDGGRLMFARFNSDPDLLDMAVHLKRLSMIADILYLDVHSYTAVIIDCQDLKYQHGLKLLSTVKTAIDIYLNAYSEGLKVIHVINMPSSMETLFNTGKTFLPEKVRQRLFVHSSPADLCKMLDEDVVCEDFGGKGPSFSKYDEYTKKLLEERREWFLEQNNISTNEELRISTKGQLEEMKGSFRKLDFD